MGKALDVLNYEKYLPVDFEVEQTDGKKLIRCKYFETTILDGDTQIPLEDDSFHAVVCISGTGELSVGDRHQSIKAGESVFIPASNDMLDITGEISVAITKA